MPPAAQPATSKRALLLIPIAVLLTIHPLLIHGPSCGQDLTFHLQSWLDAAQQLRHGTLYPHWDITAAWNAGEPRFLFYPPLSWLLGAVLTLVFPISLCPTIYIAIALLASGLTFHKLASQFASPNAALIASTLYLANPYMLFCAFERSAFAELLAAAWLPLLLLALLRPRPTAQSIAVPLALLWLTNAPAAVISSYTLALLATLRVLFCLCCSRRLCSSDCHCFSDCHSERNEEPASRAKRVRSSLRFAITTLAGTLLGLTLPAIYLLPAAYERRFIQTSMAIIPSLRYQDNFLFAHTSDAAHNAVNHTISLLALTLLTLTTAALIALRLRTNSTPPSPAKTLTLPLALLTALIALLLTPLSTPIWQHLPDLAYLQFPWRLLTLLTPILALTLALLLTGNDMGAPGPASGTWVRRTPTTIAAALILPLALTALAYNLYRQPCDLDDSPTTLAHLFATHHGSPPTDEYTPTLADNDPLRTDNPAYWLAHSPNDPAPNTLPTAVELNPNLDTDDTPIPPAQTLSTPAPHHLTVALTQPSLLVLNLRAYPNWHIATTPKLSPSAQDSPQTRNDGLITIPLPAGTSTLTITWRRTPDQQLGLALTLLSLLTLALTCLHRPARNTSA